MFFSGVSNYEICLSSFKHENMADCVLALPLLSRHTHIESFTNRENRKPLMVNHGEQNNYLLSKLVMLF